MLSVVLLGLALLAITALGWARAHSAGPSKRVEAAPGWYYDIALPVPDEVPTGTRWVGGKMVAKGGESLAEPVREPGPLEPMYRNRLIVKLDDLSTNGLGYFQRWASVVEQHGAKADLGISPGLCRPEVYAWIRSLDPDRFEIWNHTWDHGENGPRQFGQPYDAQYENINRCQQTVSEETGLTMRAFGEPGIRHGEGWIADVDAVTFLVVRNHPDLVAMFGGGRWREQLGLPDSSDVFTPVSLTWVDGPPRLGDRGDPARRYHIRWVEELYPGEDPYRPPIVGNAAELIWRVEHPDAGRAHVERLGCAFLQFHPWFWCEDGDIAAVGEWIDHIHAARSWRFANCYEAYRWWRDRDAVVLEKRAPDRYRLDAHLLLFPHQMELALPAESRVEGRAYHIHSYDT